MRLSETERKNNNKKTKTKVHKDRKRGSLLLKKVTLPMPLIK